MNVWITTAGTSPFAAINSIWAAVQHKKFIPGKVHILANEFVIEQNYLEKVVKGCEIISNEYDFSLEILTHCFTETDFSSYANLLESLVAKEKKAGNNVAIDMTPGRKFMSAISMYLGVGPDIKFKADLIYYHHLLDLSFGNLPYPLIPSNIRTLYNMKDRSQGGA